MKLDTKYLSLDLEMNQPSRKIIQVGVSIGSLTDYRNNELESYVWYLDPEEEITEFITDLTGITNRDIKDFAITHQELSDRLVGLIDKNKCFVNPVVWGIGDSETLTNEFKSRNIEFQRLGRRSIDLKTWYVMNRISDNKSHSGGLSSSMAALSNNKLKFAGLAHRADVDAMNTLRLFFYIMEREMKVKQLIKEFATL